MKKNFLIGLGYAALSITMIKADFWSDLKQKTQQTLKTVASSSPEDIIKKLSSTSPEELARQLHEKTQQALNKIKATPEELAKLSDKARKELLEKQELLRLEVEKIKTMGPEQLKQVEEKAKRFHATAQQLALEEAQKGKTLAEPFYTHLQKLGQAARQTLATGKQSGRSFLENVKLQEERRRLADSFKQLRQS